MSRAGILEVMPSRKRLFTEPASVGSRQEGQGAADTSGGGGYIRRGAAPWPSRPPTIGCGYPRVRLVMHVLTTLGAPCSWLPSAAAGWTMTTAHPGSDAVWVRMIVADPPLTTTLDGCCSWCRR
jgi:hypothetical protein